MGQVNSNPCGNNFSTREYRSCMNTRAADYDWKIEKGTIEGVYDNFPKYYEGVLRDAYAEGRPKALKEYEDSLKTQLDETKKVYEQQYQETVASYQKAIEDYVSKGKQSCDEIKNSPEFKQKQQEVVDLKNKQAEQSVALQKMNFENVHRTEINRALNKIIPGANGCDISTAEKQEEETKNNIEEDVAEEQDEQDQAEGGGLPEVVYNINKRYIMHNQEQSPLSKMNKIYRKK